MEKLAAVDALKQLKADKEKELQNLNETAGASGHQKLRVCETCGAMLSVLDSDKRLADHFGGKMHLGYHELRKLLATMAEERMSGHANGPPPSFGAPPVAGPNAIPPGPRANPPPSAPSGPSNHFPNHSQNNNHLAPPRRESMLSPDEPRTPSHSRVPPADEMPVVGHGEKIKREAGELVEDIKSERGERERDRERDRYDRRDREKERDGDKDGERKHRHRDEDGERYEKYDKYEKYDREGKDRSSRHDERDRRDRDRSETHRDRDRKYEDDRHRTSTRSRSPPKRRVV